jgi:hypothetical protein
MAQSEAERAAERELATAIENYLSVHGVDPGFVLSNWIVLTSMDGYTDDTVGQSRYPRILPQEGEASFDKVLGMVRFHELRLEKDALDDD